MNKMKKRPAVFVVDDEERMCKSLRSILERRGFDVETATSGESALQTMANKDFDLFLLDVFIPDVDGFRLMENIFARCPNAPVVMMSGDASVDSALKALKRGAYDLLKKPFEPEHLEKTIENAIRQKMLTEKSRYMEARLKASERRFRFMIQKSPDMIYTLDKNGKFTFVNDAAEGLFGYRAADLLGKHYNRVLHDDDAEKAVWRFNERRTGDRATAGYELRLKTGPLKKATTPKHPGYAIVELNATGIYHQKQTGLSPELIGTYGVARDKTYRKILETQLLQAKKMEAIGNLAGGIAHDFNNLLMGIQGIVSLMLLKMDPDHPFLDQVRTIEQYVQDAAGLTRQMLTFARGGAVETKPTDINTLIEKQSRMFGRTRKEIDISEALVPNVLPVEADDSQIEQVLLNLYVNAGHAMPDGGRLHVKTENVLLSEGNFLTESTQLNPGRHVKVTISDTGIGMDEKTMQRIFDPFFTTKNLGKGSGLGLYCSYGIIKNHGGHIQVVSKQGIGTTFIIYLPASEKKISVTASPSPKQILGRETILLVDDESRVRHTCRDSLKLLGYAVMTAASGDEAVEIYSKKAAAIDIVVLDMIMPGLSGKETYRCLKKINPEVRVLLASGYAVNGQGKEIMDEGCNAYIQKPFKIEQLSLLIRNMMENECPDLQTIET
jgi:PAS domain S-box-containing protein